MGGQGLASCKARKCSFVLCSRESSPQCWLALPDFSHVHLALLFDAISSLHHFGSRVAMATEHSFNNLFVVHLFQVDIILDSSYFNRCYSVQHAACCRRKRNKNTVYLVSVNHLSVQVACKDSSSKNQKLNCRRFRDI